MRKRSVAMQLLVMLINSNIIADMLYYLSKQAAGEKALADVVASLEPLLAALESKEGTGTVQERIKLDEVSNQLTCDITLH
jgi:Sigma-S stabilisation anti-adaptor protein